MAHNSVVKMEMVRFLRSFQKGQTSLFRLVPLLEISKENMLEIDRDWENTIDCLWMRLEENNAITLDMGLEVPPARFRPQLSAAAAEMISFLKRM